MSRRIGIQTMEVTEQIEGTPIAAGESIRLVFWANGTVSWMPVDEPEPAGGTS